MAEYRFGGGPGCERSLVLAEPSVTGTALIMMLAANLGEKDDPRKTPPANLIFRNWGQLLIRMGASIDGLGYEPLACLWKA